MYFKIEQQNYFNIIRQLSQINNCKIWIAAATETNDPILVVGTKRYLDFATTSLVLDELDTIFPGSKIEVLSEKVFLELEKESKMVLINTP